MSRRPFLFLLASAWAVLPAVYDSLAIPVTQPDRSGTGSGFAGGIRSSSARHHGVKTL